MELCFQSHRYELPPTSSIVRPMSLLTQACFEYALCPPSCWMLKPTAATARPITTASGAIAHQLVAKKRSIRYTPTNHARITEVLKYICGQSRRGRPDCSK